LLELVNLDLTRADVFLFFSLMTARYHCCTFFLINKTILIP